MTAYHERLMKGEYAPKKTAKKTAAKTAEPEKTAETKAAPAEAKKTEGGK